MTQSKTKVSGNTKPRPTTRSRQWTFTLNNYKKEDIKNFCMLNAEYVFQEETGEQGTPHLQGVVIFKNARTLSSMKRLEGRTHWEVCRDKSASIVYCSKDDTRTGQIYTNIDIKKHVHRDMTQHNDKIVKKVVPTKEELEKNRDDFFNDIKEDPAWNHILPKSWIDHEINMLMQLGVGSASQSVSNGQ